MTRLLPILALALAGCGANADPDVHAAYCADRRCPPPSRAAVIGFADTGRWCVCVPGPASPPPANRGER